MEPDWVSKSSILIRKGGETIADRVMISERPGYVKKSTSQKYDHPQGRDCFFSDVS